jgi:hypothetical protein
VPYIYEDRLSQKDFTETLKKALNVSKKAYNKMSVGGIEHVKNNYNFKNYQEEWVNLMDSIVEKHGSWETRKGYKRWHLLEVA